MRTAHLPLSKLTIASLLVVASVLTLTILPANIQAQQATEDQVTLTAIPPRYGDDNSLLLQPGEKTQVQVRVRNSSPKTLPITTLATDFILDVDGETPIPVTENVSNRWSLANWLTVVPQSQVLQPQETGVVNILIEVPEDALPGGHYAMITHQPSLDSVEGESAAAEVDSAAGINQRVGTLLYVVVDGLINEEAFIRDFTFPVFTEYGPVPYSFVIENASDIHIQPKTSIEIFDWMGNRVDQITVTEKNVFPLMNRTFDGVWERIWGYGRYTAEATMSFGSAGRVVIAKTTFWLLPIKLVLAAIILLLTLIALFISIRRHMIHRNDPQNAKVELLEKRLQQLEQEKLQQYEE